MFKEGDRVQNTFTGLIAKVIRIQEGLFPRYWFAVRFEDDAAGARHYARNGPDGLFVFTNAGPWMKIDDPPVPMEDTRDYLDALMSLRA